jgi:Flp pilus assembly protein TadB
VDTRFVIGVAALLLAVISGGIFLYQLLGRGQKGSFNNLLFRPSDGGDAEVLDPMVAQSTNKLNQFGEQDYEKLKDELQRKAKGKQKPTLDERFFQAGVFTDKDKDDFKRLRIIAFVLCTGVLGFTAGYYTGIDFFVIGVVVGALVGLQVPFSILDRRIAKRSEEIMFYLPLVIEQISIGVSSSLDVGPCLERVVSMADERDTHNVVTELVRHAQFYVRSGVSLQDAMTEVGRLSGHTELKHAFMSLSQVAKHGGEITRQLQELADAVAMQRETKIEEKIKKLELEATGPVALVFVGFMIILLVGFGLQIQGAF